MFLYEKKNVFAEDGKGPLQGLNAKSTPEGIVDAHPARLNDVVLFAEESKDGMELHEAFVIGEEKEETSEEEIDESDTDDLDGQEDE